MVSLCLKVLLLKKTVIALLTNVGYGLKDTPKSVAMCAAHKMNEWRAFNTS
jgi:hypothetical protein